MTYNERTEAEREFGCNTDAELDLLTAILHQNDILHHLPFLKAEHFALELHQKLFTACDRRISNGEKVTLFTVIDELGDRQAARQLLRHTHFCVAPVETARVIVDLANIRSLIEACQDVLTGFASDPSQTFPEVAGPINRVMQDSAASDGTKRQRGEADVIAEILEDMKTRKKPTSTGLSRLDGAMGGGLYAGRAYGFAARKKGWQDHIGQHDQLQT